MGEAIKDYFPVFELSTGTVIVGLLMMLAFGIITGMWPALTAMRLKIVDALRRV
jgi:ABC-type antimicrobial peptide transport system permease subunit